MSAIDKIINARALSIDAAKNAEGDKVRTENDILAETMLRALREQLGEAAYGELDFEDGQKIKMSDYNGCRLASLELPASQTMMLCPITITLTNRGAWSMDVHIGESRSLTYDRLEHMADVLLAARAHYPDRKRGEDEKKAALYRKVFEDDDASFDQVSEAAAELEALGKGDEAAELLREWHERRDRHEQAKEAVAAYGAAYTDYLERRRSTVAANKLVLQQYQERLDEMVYEVAKLTYGLAGEDDYGEIVGWTETCDVLDDGNNGIYTVVDQGKITRTRIHNPIKVTVPAVVKPSDSATAARLWVRDGDKYGVDGESILFSPFADSKIVKTELESLVAGMTPLPVAPEPSSDLLQWFSFLDDKGPLDIYAWGVRRIFGEG